MKTPAKKRLGRPAGTGNAEATRERILKAAMQCFAKGGYTQASNKQIAEMAGITSGSLYHYFGSKAELYGAVLLNVLSTLVEAYRSSALKHEHSVDKLCAGLERVIIISSEQPGLMEFASMAHGEVQRYPELNELLSNDHQEFYTFFIELLSEAHQQGELLVPVEAAVHTLIACTTGLSLIRSSLEREEQFANALRAFQSLLRGAFFKQN